MLQQGVGAFKGEHGLHTASIENKDQAKNSKCSKRLEHAR